MYREQPTIITPYTLLYIVTFEWLTLFTDLHSQSYKGNTSVQFHITSEEQSFVHACFLISNSTHYHLYSLYREQLRVTDEEENVNVYTLLSAICPYRC